MTQVILCPVLLVTSLAAPQPNQHFGTPGTCLLPNLSCESQQYLVTYHLTRKPGANIAGNLVFTITVFLIKQTTPPPTIPVQQMPSIWLGTHVSVRHTSALRCDHDVKS